MQKLWINARQLFGWHPCLNDIRPTNFCQGFCKNAAHASHCWRCSTTSFWTPGCSMHFSDMTYQMLQKTKDAMNHLWPTAINHLWVWPTAKIMILILQHFKFIPVLIFYTQWSIQYNAYTTHTSLLRYASSRNMSWIFSGDAFSIGMGKFWSKLSILIPGSRVSPRSSLGFPAVELLR